MKRLVVGIGGGTGAVYGIRLLEALRGLAGVETHLVIGEAGRRGIAAETDYSPGAVEALAARVYDDRDIGAPLASDSCRTDGMVVAPCDVDTLAALAASQACTLIACAGDVTLKEGRPLVLVVLETPLHLGPARRLRALAEMGATILPPMPAFYPRPKTVDDLIGHTIGRVLDRLGIAHGLVAEWTGTGRTRRDKR